MEISFVLPAALFFVHVICLVAWSLTFESHSFRWIGRLGGAYLHVLGVDQQWRMFRNPSTTQQRLEIQVICSDRSYSWQVNVGEYWRKLEERLLLAGDHELGIAVARYVAGTAARSGQKPQEIKILRHWSAIPRPGADREEPWRTDEVLGYRVNPQDLQ